MKIVLAPNAFKGSLTALQVAEAMQAGVQRILPKADTHLLPIADGGDGTLDVIIGVSGGELIPVEVLDPLGRPITAHYGLLPDKSTAIIEMAAASGLRLIRHDERNPMQTTTYGTGQLIKAALGRGCTRIVVGVGGSATVDGGIGMAQALGVRLLRADGRQVGYGGDGLAQITHIDITERDPRIAEVEIQVASDVTNPLVGETGAARIFGPQKGATPAMVAQLDDALSRLAETILHDVGQSVAEMLGAGAAGGLGAGLAAFVDAEIVSGAEIVLDLLKADSVLEDADLVITGEGQLDQQTIYGKAPIAVARRAKKYNLPVIAVAGGLSDDVDVVYQHGIDALMPIVSRPMPLEDAIKDAATLIKSATERALRLLMLGH